MIMSSVQRNRQKVLHGTVSAPTYITCMRCRRISRLIPGVPVGNFARNPPPSIYPVGTASHTTPLIKYAKRTPHAPIATSAPSVAVGNPTPASPMPIGCAPLTRTAPAVTQGLAEGRMPTPVQADRLSELLTHYHDRGYLVNGIKAGFNLGFKGINCSVRSKNSQSVRKNLDAAMGKVEQERAKGRIAGPFDVPPFPYFKQTPLAMREKSTPRLYCRQRQYTGRVHET